MRAMYEEVAIIDDNPPARRQWRSKALSATPDIKATPWLTHDEATNAIAPEADDRVIGNAPMRRRRWVARE
ncbi:MAG: hypothetical protein LBE78_12800 [Burkholderiaceae bacterium]|jgi:hypothetical protein|nr:hypothetical protein [Burkholderiaceae bacterium]